MALVRLLWAFWLMSSFHVGSAAAHLFCLYQTYSGGFCWKSKKAHDFLCVRGLFLGKTYTILGCYKQHVFLKTCTELKASIQKKKKSHFSVPACFDVSLDRRKASTLEKGRICIWWCQRARWTISAGCVSLCVPLSSCFICLQDGEKKLFPQRHICTPFDSALEHLLSIMWL